MIAIEAENDTKTRLLNVAERMFADRGFSGVSLRQLTAAAGANLAAVNYHFGSKEGLLTAIFESRCRPVNEARFERLGRCAEGPGRPPLLEQIISAFIVPPLSATAESEGGATFTRLRAMLSVEHNELAASLIAKHFDAASTRFIDALAASLPHLSRAEVMWRFYFLLGALYFARVNPARIIHLSGGACDAGNVDSVLEQMVPFLAAGFRAPSVGAGGSRRATRG
jgi:AcrR family transcriptional regulator